MRVMETLSIKNEIRKLLVFLKIEDRENEIEHKDHGCPHKPESLEKGKMAIYIFIHNEIFLKIGKVGEKSKARFLSQHYGTTRSNSNLAKSILNNEKMVKRYSLDTKKNIGEWIMENTQRIDILIPTDFGMKFLSLLEAYLHYQYKPRFEGKIEEE